MEGRKSDMFHRNWKVQIKSSEKQRGLVFILLYLFVFPKLSEWLQRYLSREDEFLLVQVNVVYYGILFLLTLLAFWSFLKNDFLGLLDWLPENLSAAAFGVLMAGGVRYGLGYIPFPVEDPVPLQYAEQFRVSPAATLLLILLLIPLVEETVFRGYIYGHLREYSRPLAMVVSVLIYSVSTVWRYALNLGDARYLWLILFQIPVAVALNVCYEDAGSVWGCSLLHAGYNAVLLFLIGL